MSKASKYLVGQLLLDGGNLKGSYFHRSVVLVCQHDDQGAFGLVLNRASSSKVEDVIETALPLRLEPLPLYVGGPVQANALSYLHTDVFVPHASVMPNLNLGHSLEGLVELGESYSTTQKVRVFAGYAGWSPGQLEDEMKRQSWLTHPASLELVFETPPQELWRIIMRMKGWQERLLADGPEDLSWN
ncbi:MAG: YqgE/AlgH family protein [Verrucomicrobiota bacterium]